jgi:phenylalanyl-tRNA synthetase beta chain
MKIPLEWLKDYIDLEMGVEELADLLTNTGSAVESIDYPGRGVKGIVAGVVRATRPHPQASKLTLCDVDWGQGIQEIACGAPNVREGMQVAVAPPGSILPGDRHIEKVSIRGVESNGMLCSGDELGINDDTSGILTLEEGIPIGSELAALFGLGEAVLDLEITPNRPDCLCVMGMAREIAVLTGLTWRRPQIKLVETGGPVGDGYSVEILDPDLCTRYVARVIEGVSIHPAPLWMQRRLKLAGVRSISNIVDVTNYVMLETGQPLHAFDAKKVAEGRILVRRARDGEEMVTLDGASRRLHPSTLLICDPTGPVALAGVMGGESTEVSQETRAIFLESAHFYPPSIMRTAREQELPSEASYRFERGVDPAGCRHAADRAISLMLELAGGSIRSGAIDALPVPIVPVRLDLRTKKAERLLGIDLEMSWVSETMSKLGLEIVYEDRESENLTLDAPTFRPDLEREIDLIEEIARVYGYSRVKSTLPTNRTGHGGLNCEQKSERRLRELLAGLGLYEVITYAFVPGESNALFSAEGKADALVIANPLSEEAGEMRTTIYPGLIGTMIHNFNRHQTSLGIFEIGRVFHPQTGSRLPREDLMLGIALQGSWIPRQWDTPAVRADFFTLKGIWENLLECFSFTETSIRTKRLPYFHPALSAELQVKSQPVGEMGMIHPILLKKLGLPDGVAALQVDLGRLFAISHGEAIYGEVPRFPAIQMDLSLVVDEDVKVEALLRIIRENGGALLKDASLFDLYRGDQIAYGEKSLTFNLSFYDVNRTLKDEEAKEGFRGIVDALKRELGVEIRE